MLEKINELINETKYQKALELIEANENKNNYYELFYLKIKCLIGLNKCEEALSLLDEELSMPYIPLMYEDSFKALRNEVAGILKQSERFHSFEIENVNIEQILNSGSNEEKLELLLYFKKASIRKYLANFKNWLLDDTEPILKSLFLLMCVEQEILEEIRINKDGLFLDVIPYELEKIEDSKLVGEVSNTLQNLIGYKEPSLLQICLDIFDLYLITVYPLLPDESEAKTLSLALIWVALNSLKRSEEIDKYLENIAIERLLIAEYVKILEKVLENNANSY